MSNDVNLMLNALANEQMPCISHLGPSLLWKTVQKMLLPLTSSSSYSNL